MRADQARQIPISLYLERSGIRPAKVTRQGRELWYSSPIREGDDTPSFKVDTEKNLWFDHGLGVGGNVIDLVIEMRRVTVKEALAILESGFAGTVPARTPLPQIAGAPAGEKEKDSYSLEVVERACGRASGAAAVSRSPLYIDMAVARRWLKELRYRPAGDLKQFFALGFLAAVASTREAPCSRASSARTRISAASGSPTRERLPCSRGRSISCHGCRCANWSSPIAPSSSCIPSRSSAARSKRSRSTVSVACSCISITIRPAARRRTAFSARTRQPQRRRPLVDLSRVQGPQRVAGGDRAPHHPWIRLGCLLRAAAGLRETRRTSYETTW